MKLGVLNKHYLMRYINKVGFVGPRNLAPGENLVEIVRYNKLMRAKRTMASFVVLQSHSMNLMNHYLWKQIYLLRGTIKRNIPVGLCFVRGKAKVLITYTHVSLVLLWILSQRGRGSCTISTCVLDIGENFDTQQYFLTRVTNLFVLLVHVKTYLFHGDYLAPCQQKDSWIHFYY